MALAKYCVFRLKPLIGNQINLFKKLCGSASFHDYFGSIIKKLCALASLWQKKNKTKTNFKYAKIDTKTVNLELIRQSFNLKLETK
jgi:hypothetical protein